VLKPQAVELGWCGQRARQGAAVAVFVVPEEEDAELVLGALEPEVGEAADVESDLPEVPELFASLEDPESVELAAAVLADFESERASLR
jgi:hypothetical protein